MFIYTHTHIYTCIYMCVCVCVYIYGAPLFWMKSYWENLQILHTM